MLWFNQTKNLGFILTDEGERLRVAGSGFAPGQKPKGRCARSVVSFEITETSGERQAEGVAFVPEVAARRARLRTGRGLRVR
jgi:cold shock CspA family protein